MHRKIYSLLHRHYHLKYHGVYRHAKKLFAFDLLLLTSTIALLGAVIFFSLWWPGLTDKIDLSLSIGGDRVLSGQAVTISIKYTNRNSQALTEPILGVRLPAGFVIDRAKTPVSEFSDEHIFKLKNLEPGASGEAVIQGRLWTNINQTENVEAFLSYRPTKMDYREQKTAQFILQLPESVLKAELEMPEKTFNGVILPITYRLTNVGTEKILNAKITFAGLRKQTITVAAINPGESEIIRLNAEAPTAPGTYNLRAATQLQINGEWLEQTITDRKVQIIAPDVSARAKIDSTAGYAEPGQTLPVTISWKNNSEFILYNPRLRITFTPGTVDATATARANGFTASGNDVLVDKRRRTALYSGAPGNGDDFQMNVILAGHFELGQKEKARLEITPVVETEMEAIPEQKLQIYGTPASLPLATEVLFNAEARYYTEEGDQLGRGPLPPRTGETTKYWIFAEIINTSNAIANTTFFTTLPAGAEFTGRQSVTIGPALKYDNPTRSVNWNYNYLPANSRTGLYFEVAVTPSAEQIGKNLLLTNILSLTTADDWTGKTFALNLAGVKNILPAGDKGATKGATVE